MDIKDIENLAELAKLDLTEEEKARLLLDVRGILDYVKVIESVEVEDKEFDHNVYNVWREDKSNPSVFSHDLIVGQFPDSHEGFLKVKKIL